MATAAISAIGVASSYMGAKRADRRARQAMAAQEKAAKAQLDFAKEQWDFWKTNIQPIEQEAMELGIDAQKLALQRGQDEYEMYQEFYKPMQMKMSELAMEGVKDRTKEATRDAANTVDKAFERQRQVMQRTLERKGIRPDSGRYQATDKTLGLQQAATRAGEVNKAREREISRQETLDFNRLATAARGGAAAPAMSGFQNYSGLTPSSIGGLMTNATNSLASSANARGREAAYAAQGFGSAVKGALGLYLRSQDSPDGGAGWNNWDTADASTGYGGAEMGSGAEFDKFYHGGLVDKRNRYAGGGMVHGKPGIDNVPALIDGQKPALLTSGEYVIPKDVVDKKGKKFFDNLIDKMHDTKYGVKR